MSVWGKITGKRKQFMSLLCDNVPPYEACRAVWPKIKDVYGHVRSVCNDAEFKEVYARLTDFQSSREQLIAKCMRIIESDDTDKHMAAIRTIAALRGYVEPGGRPSHKTKLKPAIEDDKVLLDKVAELAMKARDHGDHGRKAN